MAPIDCCYTGAARNQRLPDWRGCGGRRPFLSNANQAGMPRPCAAQALPETNGFLTGETVVVDNQPKAVVRFWDLACEPLTCLLLLLARAAGAAVPAAAVPAAAATAVSPPLLLPSLCPLRCCCRRCVPAAAAGMRQLSLPCSLPLLAFA